MTRSERKALNRAAKLLEGDARCLRTCMTIQTPGHPQFNQWPAEDHGAKADYDQRIATAQKLRAMAEKGLQ